MQTREATKLDHLRLVLERWLDDARTGCTTSTHNSDLDWLSGRIRALNDVLAFLTDGTDPSPAGSLPIDHHRDEPANGAVSD